MTVKTQNIQELQIEIVGGTNFGRFPKISREQTWNMIVSDNFLVPFAGYKLKVELLTNGAGTGRGIFNSVKLGALIVVVDNVVFLVDNDNSYTQLGSIDTYGGPVFIDENIAQQIAICDQKDIWIYDYSKKPTTFQKAPLNFTPNYIAFQDGYFIAPVQGSSQWRLSAPNNGLSWPTAAQNVGAFQTKPDNVVACVRMPSKGNLLLVMGKTVTEAWVDVGANLFPYQRSSQYNIDYGCLSPETIATSDQFIVWLGTNEKSGPVILVSDGGPPIQISNEGWNFKFAQLKYPEQSYGFLFKQDGHLLYQLTFSNPADNFSLIYDFSTKMFFNVSNENLDIHIARKVAFFNNTYYFISSIDGNIYELSTNYFNLNGIEMPMIRITPNHRLPDTGYFVCNNLTFTIEQGTNPENEVNIPSNFNTVNELGTAYGTVLSLSTGKLLGINNYLSDDNVLDRYNFEINKLPTTPRVDMAISKDGGETFSSFVTKWMRPIGYRKNRLNYWSLGAANEVCFQIRFQGNQRFVVGNGLFSFYR